MQIPVSDVIVPPKCIESGFGYIIIRSPYTPHSIYFRGTIDTSRVTLGSSYLANHENVQYCGHAVKILRLGHRQ